MFRPKYETEEQRRMEKLAFDDYCIVANVSGRFLQTKPLTFFDAILLGEDAKQTSIWEVKIRHRTYADLMALGGVYLSLEKFMKIVTASKALGIPAYMLLKASDGLYVKELKEMRVSITYGGRTDRDDHQDIELCVLLTDFIPAGSKT